jgi:hypothetical protein
MNLDMKQIHKQVLTFSQCQIGTFEENGQEQPKFPPLKEVNKYKKALIRDNLDYLVESDLIGV